MKQKKQTEDFAPHTHKQDSLVFSEADLTIGATGTQWGKSIAGSYWMYRQLCEFTDPTDNFILMAPTYKIMAQSMQPYFLHVMRGMGTHLKTDSLFEMYDGRRVYFRTETDPDSIVGIPNVRAYWLDEAGKVSLYFHENIQARAASLGARGLYTTSPYARNWLYKDYIRKITKGKSSVAHLIQAASWENPYHSLYDPSKRDAMRAQMDPRRFDMLFGGEWGKKSGLVYDCFDDEANMVAPFRLPNGTIFYAGVDWGHTEPFALVVRAVTPDNQHYQVSEFYKSGMNILQQIDIAHQKMSVFGIKQFFCGHERPENIQLFNQKGLPAVPIPEKDIQVGTGLHYELIKTRRYKVFTGSSPYTLDEYETYHYPEPLELSDDQNAKDPGPVGQNDHCMSANRFVTLRTYQSQIRYKPFTPMTDGDDRRESQETRLKRLMKPKNRTRIFQ